MVDISPPVVSWWMLRNREIPTVWLRSEPGGGQVCDRRIFVVDRRDQRSDVAAYWMTRWDRDFRSPQQREVSLGIPQVRPLLLQDHAHAITDRGMPVPAAPWVVAHLGEQLRRGVG